MMFGIGPGETIIILIIIILLVKPDDIPGFIHKVGKLFGKLRQSYDELVRNIRDLENKVKDQIDDYAAIEENKTDNNTAINENEHQDEYSEETKTNNIKEEGKKKVILKSGKRKADKRKKTVKSKIKKPKRIKKNKT